MTGICDYSQGEATHGVGSRAFASITRLQVFEDGANSFERFVENHQGEDGLDHIVRSQGCSSLLIPRCQRVTQTFVVGPGCCLYWEFEVQASDKTVLVHAVKDACVASRAHRVTRSLELVSQGRDR